LDGYPSSRKPGSGKWIEFKRANRKTWRDKTAYRVRRCFEILVNTMLGMSTKGIM